MDRFSKFKQKNEIYEKFEEFLSKLVWRETLFKFLHLNQNGLHANAIAMA